MIEQIKGRIKEIEAAIEKMVHDHNALQGHLAEAKYFLDMATKVADEVAPQAPATEVFDAVDKVADAIIE